MDRHIAHKLALLLAVLVLPLLCAPAASADTIRVSTGVPSPYPFDEQPPREHPGSPVGWGGGCFQGPLTGKTNFYIPAAASDGVGLQDMFGATPITIADLASLSFWTNKATGIPANRDWWITIYTLETGTDDAAGGTRAG